MNPTRLTAARHRAVAVATVAQEMATQTERRNATRRAILDAAVDAYIADDISVALERIAVDAGVTKSTIHYHFGSRDGLWRSVAEYVFGRIEARFARLPDDVDVSTWVRMVLAEQATPRGRLLFAINDELARTGDLIDADPFPYLALRLGEFGIDAPPAVIAAAMIQYGRQLAFGAITDIDDVMADLAEVL